MPRALARHDDAALIRLLRALIVLALIFAASLARAAAPQYPELTGRVVDQAGIIPAPTRATLQARLKDLEDKSGVQLVVATIRSLGEEDVETYANGLFRYWKLGEAKKNNGVLFLVAPNDRKMRIEVGYGLEGTLTDALSKVILATAVAPKFKAGDFGGGVERGVDGVIEVLSGDSAEWVKKVPPPPSLLDEMFPLIIFALFVFIFLMMARNAGRPGAPRSYRRGGPTIIILPPGGGGWDNSGGSSWGGGGGDFDGFSGGGGSSGGGGASGDW